MSEHPGRVLARALAIRKMSQTELAARIHRPLQAISEIVTGKKRITPRMAIQLGDALGPDAEYWWGLECAYELQTARKEMDRFSRIEVVS